MVMHLVGLAHVGLTFNSTTNICDGYGDGGDSNDNSLVDRCNSNPDGGAVIIFLYIVGESCK